MGHTIKLAALGAVAFMVLDGVWLGLLMQNSYREQLAPIVRLADGSIAPNWPAAFVVYALLGTGIALFVIPRASTVTFAVPTAPCSGLWCTALRLHQLLHAAAVAVRVGAGRHGVGSSGVSRMRGNCSDRGPVKKPHDTPAHYPIRAVSKLTGVAIDTLRAWERRHSAVTPSRDDRGRMYTGADVARLRLLRGAVERGHSIGRLASLTDAELHHLAAAGATAVSEVDPTRRTPIDTAALAAALQKYDATAIDQQISRLASVLPPLDLLRDVLMPVLEQVGDDWHRGSARIAQEHLMSSTMRNILGSFLRLYARPEVSTRLLFATPAGERHEIGTLGAAMLAASSGLGIAYLGPDLPAREIVASVKPAGAQVLVLGLTATLADKATQRELRTIVRDLPKEVEFWTGGRGAVPHTALISPRGLVLRDYNAYQQELARIGGRVA
jgi:DNA-binding transcriptional MerR regulator/uncharacterized membrane protein